MKFICIIGLPGSGKTTISNLLFKKNMAKWILSIGAFRNALRKWIPKKINDHVIESMSWEFYRSSIHYSFLDHVDDVAILNLCGINERERKIFETLEGYDTYVVKLICDKDTLYKRIDSRGNKNKQGFFPYNISFKELIDLGFNKHIKNLKTDLIIHTDKLSIKECVCKIKESYEKYQNKNQ